jgi:chitinase
VGRSTRILIALLLGVSASAPAAGAQAPWVTGYCTGWRQSRLDPQSIDYSAVTHLVQFSVVPRADGTLDAATNMLTPANVKAAVEAAHAAGKKILFTVGGQNTRKQFEGAIGAAHRRAFIAALVEFMRDNGYDGIDVDMEDMVAGDARGYVGFIRELRAALDGLAPRPLLTAAALWQPAVFARLAGEFDQINLMTYNLSGPYPGWVVWHSGSIFDGGQRFPNGRSSLPSVDGLTREFLAAGVPKSKLGAGLSFNGYVWSGGEVSRPRQGWTVAPSVKNVPYYALAETYQIVEGDESSPNYHWDEAAQAAYLSIEGATPADAAFVSYDNAMTAAMMMRYVQNEGLGGLFVWDLGAGYRTDQPPGRRDLLLQAVKRARLDAKGDGR